jgi:formylmethanofuran dehydrogenase subunit A
MANNEIVLDLLEAGEFERAKDVVAWLIWAAKAYGVKAVNPGGVAAWKWGKDAKQIAEPVTGYSKVTPGKIIASLAQMIDQLGLPHPLHLHCNNLGAPGNVATTLETMKVIDGNRAHMAHLQFHAYGGDDWHTIRSEAAAIADEFNKRPNLTCDAGAVLFGNAVTITADGPWQHLLYQLTGRKWGNLDVENETGCGIVPYTYKGSNLVNAVQWAAGLELLLLINDPWRIFLTTDHPNGACFWRYPEIIHLLMNSAFRRERVKALPAKALERIVLAELDREYSLYEIAIITSAGPARALGLSQKGHLGIGADADVAIYNENPDGELMFRYPRYVIKAGEIVVEEGDVKAHGDGRAFVIHPNCDPAIEAYLRPLFQQYYTMSFDNYPVELDRIEHAEVRSL